MPISIRNIKQEVILTVLTMYVTSTTVASSIKAKVAEHAKDTWDTVKEKTKKVPRAVKRFWNRHRPPILPFANINLNITGFFSRKSSVTAAQFNKLSPLQKFETAFVNKVDPSRKPLKSCRKPESNLDLKHGRGKKTVSFSDQVSVSAAPSYFVAQVIPVKYSNMFQYRDHMKLHDANGVEKYHSCNEHATSFDAREYRKRINNARVNRLQYVNLLDGITDDVEISDKELIGVELVSEKFNTIFKPVPEEYIEYGMGALFVDRVTLFEIVMFLSTLKYADIHFDKWIGELAAARQVGMNMIENHWKEDADPPRKTSVEAIESVAPSEMAMSNK